MKSKYKIFLNMLLIILVILAIGIIGYIAYDYISNYILTREAEEAVNLFENQINENKNQNAIIVDIENVQNNEINNEPINNTTTTNNTPTTIKYKGYNIVGSIQIPKTNVKYPVVDTITPDAIAVSVTAIYGPGLNEVRKYSFGST